VTIAEECKPDGWGCTFLRARVFLGANVMAKIAINGLGRIGRAFLKLALRHPAVEVVAINDLADASNLAYLMRFDSVYRRYEQPVSVESLNGHARLRVGDQTILLLQERDPARLPWRRLDIDIVVESSGAYESYDKARAHLRAGAKRVVLTAPAKDADGDDAQTILMGVNAQRIGSCSLSSNGSCTTNSVAPALQVLQERLGVRKAMLNTVHGYTATQNLVDGPTRGRDMRRGRAGAVSIVPATTGAALAVTRAIPSLRGRFDGIAMRVPVPVGALSVISFVSARPTTAEEINAMLSDAAMTARWQSVLAVTAEAVVSADIIGDPHAAIVDLSLTKVVDGDLCSIYCWYDNEFGFTNTLLEHVMEAARTMEPRERVA
jgi:glyceraldehyde 3-phosphate dehydrogenase